MADSLTVRLTAWGNSFATGSFVLNFVNVVWTIYAKLQDWKIAESKEKEKKHDTSLETNDSTQEKIKNLEKLLSQATQENKRVQDGLKQSLQQLAILQDDLDSRVKKLEQNQCKCKLTKANDIEPLKKKVKDIVSASSRFSADLGTATTSTLENKTAIVHLEKTLSNMKSCNCDSKETLVVASGASTKPTTGQLPRASSTRTIAKKPWNSDFRKNQ